MSQSTVVGKLNASNYAAFLGGNRFAVVLFDAPWDTGCGKMIRPRFEVAVEQFGHCVNFGEVDCDESPELARSIPVVNVPLVAYYRGGDLVAALISASQDVAGRTAALLVGQCIGYGDGKDVAELSALP